MFVSDALDPVAAEAVVQDGGALEGFAHAQFEVGIALFQQIARAHGPGGAAGEARARQRVAGTLHRFEQVRQGVAGDVIVPEGIAHLLKLVENHHGGVLLQLPGLVKNLLHVGLAARRGNDLTGNLAQPLKTLFAHLRRENRHAVAGQQFGVERAAPAVVARGGPHRMVVSSVKLARHQPGRQTPEAGSHPVGNHLPAMAMMRQGTPDSLLGIST